MIATAITYNEGFSEKWICCLSPIEWRGKVDVQFEDIRLSQLEHAGCHTDPCVVEGWLATLQRGGAIPPPVAVQTDRGTYYLHDGNHRLEALRGLFEATDADTLIRVAVARPRPGSRFVYRQFGYYGTYVLESECRPVDSFARATVSVVLSTVALAVTAMLPGVDKSPFFALPMLAVIVSTWMGGWKAGLTATLWSLTGIAYFLLSPGRSLWIERPDQIFQFALLGLVMVCTVGFMQYVRRHPSMTIQVSTVFQRRGGQ